ncbi:DUF1302 family protein [Thermodesulfobacteriota bacterium]
MGKATLQRFFPGLCIAAILLCCPQPAAAIDILGGLSSLDAHMSEFNPIGHHLIDPINEAVPRLHLKGYLRLDANMNVHGDDHSHGPGKIEKDWRYQKIEWLAELEASYRLSDNWELVSVVNFMYDAAYDWQGSGGLYADTVDTTYHYYHQRKQILREFYLKGFWGNFDIYLGKQQVVWGKMEGRVLDIVNPLDSREYPPAEWQDDYEYRRIPLWMANITYHWTDCSLQLLWIPDFEGSISATPGSAYFPPFISIPSIAKFTNTDKPSTAFKDHEWALRFNMQKGNWEFSLLYFYTWSDSPTNFKRRFILTKPKRGLLNLVVEPKHTRQHKFGAMAETSFYAFGKHFVISNEVVYTMNQYYSVEDEPLLPPWKLRDGVKKRDEIFFGSRWMTSFFGGELNLIFQPLAKYIIGYNHHHNSTGTNQKLLYGALTVLSKSYEFTGDRLNTTLYLLGFLNGDPSSEDEGMRGLFEVRWKVSDYIRTILYYEFFNGDHDGIYGSYTKYDNVGLYIRYEF